MIEFDVIIRTCDDDEASELNHLNKTGDYFYNFWYEDKFEYHYIIVDHKNYRLKYEIVAPKKIKFAGEAVEIESPSSEFVDDDEEW